MIRIVLSIAWWRFATSFLDWRTRSCWVSFNLFVSPLKSILRKLDEAGAPIHYPLSNTSSQLVVAISVVFSSALAKVASMSLHLKPSLPFGQDPINTILTAGAIYKAIKNLTLMDIDIKWVWYLL